jgi:pimeloyl-ACP methyl ester carboxylesterase
MTIRRNWALAAGAALGAAALFNRWSAARAERDHPPVGDFIDVDGVRLHYLKRGVGNPVVLLHGSGSIVHDFLVSGLVDDLVATHQVIVFDRPGYGYSTRPRDRAWTPEAQADVIARACADLGIERPVVVGHSWGTLPALAWALDRPNEVAALVLMSGYYFATPRPDALLTGLLAAPAIGDAFTWTIAPLQTRLTGPLGIKQIFAPSRPTDAFLAEMPFALMLRPSHLHATAADSGQMPLAAGRLAARYGELDLPVTVIWDEEEKLIGQSGQSARFVEALDRVKGVPLPGAGHMLHHVRREEVAAAIRAAAD